jgi:hypothetical protein
MTDCNNCTEKCPQAERAHETAKGRMYATQELVALVKKIESGQLVEVVRCKECKHMKWVEYYNTWICGAQEDSFIEVSGDFFCNYGERRTDGKTD